MHALVRPARWLYDQPYVLLMFPGLFWGANITLGRYVVDHVPPIALAQIRWTLAFFILLPFAWRHARRDWSAVRGRFWLIALLSLTGVSIYNTLVYIGLQDTPAINAALLQSFQPVMFAVFSLVIYRDRLTGNQALGIAISFVGVAAIISRGEPSRLLGFSFNEGDLWVVTAIVAYALYAAMLRSRPKIHPLSFLLVTIGLGAVLLVPATIYEVAVEGRRVPLDGLTIATGLYVAIGASLLAYFCFNRGVELIGANRAGPFMHLVPLFGSLFAIVLLGEIVRWYHLAGWLMILAGIAIAQRRSRGDVPR